MRNAGLKETQAGIKIARRNISHLRYADDTTLMAESEEELKSLLMKVKVAQLCPTLCDPINYTVHGILQARILEWGAVSFSRGSSQPRDSNLGIKWAYPVSSSTSLVAQMVKCLLHCRQALYCLSHQEVKEDAG